MMENIKKGVGFANLVLNLEETLKSLKTADDSQKEKLQECLEQVKMLALTVRFQTERLNALEARLAPRLEVPQGRIVVPNDAPAALAPPKKRARRLAPKGGAPT